MAQRIIADKKYWEEYKTLMDEHFKEMAEFWASVEGKEPKFVVEGLDGYDEFTVAADKLIDDFRKASKDLMKKHKVKLVPYNENEDD